MKIKDLKQFLGDSPDNYEIGVSGDFDPDAALYLVLLNDKVQPLKTLSLTAPASGSLPMSQLQELDGNPESI